MNKVITRSQCLVHARGHEHKTLRVKAYFAFIGHGARAAAAVLLEREIGERRDPGWSSAPSLAELLTAYIVSRALSQEIRDYTWIIKHIDRNDSSGICQELTL